VSATAPVVQVNSRSSAGSAMGAIHCCSWPTAGSAARSGDGAVTRPVGAPPVGPTRAYWRIYADRVTTTARHAVTGDGATVQLDRIRGRWLVARIVFW